MSHSFTFEGNLYRCTESALKRLVKLEATFEFCFQLCLMLDTGEIVEVGPE